MNLFIFIITAITDYVGIPTQPRHTKPDHSATDQHPPPGKIMSNFIFFDFSLDFRIYVEFQLNRNLHSYSRCCCYFAANPTACSGMNRQELSNCIRRQVNKDLCKNYNIC